MKKIFLILAIGIVSVIITGCGEAKQNRKLLYGEWWYIGESFVDDAFYYYEFKEDGTFVHFKCFGDECERGDAEWKGKYKLNGNRVTLEVTEENQKIARYGLKIRIEESLIVDFDNMYICDGEEGLDCSQKYEK